MCESVGHRQNSALCCSKCWAFSFPGTHACCVRVNAPQRRTLPTNQGASLRSWQTPIPVIRQGTVRRQRNNGLRQAHKAPPEVSRATWCHPIHRRDHLDAKLNKPIKIRVVVCLLERTNTLQKISSSSVGTSPTLPLITAPPLSSSSSRFIFSMRISRSTSASFSSVGSNADVVAEVVLGITPSCGA